MRQRNFVRSTKRSKAILSDKVENQYLVGSVSSCGHSISSHSSRLAQQGVTVRRPHAPPGKARDEPIRASLAPSDRLPRLIRQAQGKRLDGGGLVRLVALQPRLGSSAC